MDEHEVIAPWGEVDCLTWCQLKLRHGRHAGDAIFLGALVHHNLLKGRALCAQQEHSFAGPVAQAEVAPRWKIAGQKPQPGVPYLQVGRHRHSGENEKEEACQASSPHTRTSHLPPRNLCRCHYPSRRSDPGGPSRSCPAPETPGAATRRSGSVGRSPWLAP
ncbi:hypothetical protein D9M68_878120 [compost metagenome]